MPPEKKEFNKMKSWEFGNPLRNLSLMSESLMYQSHEVPYIFPILNTFKNKLVYSIVLLNTVYFGECFI